MGTLMGTLWERAQWAGARLLNFQEEMARPKRFELLTPRFVVWWPLPFSLLFNRAECRTSRSFNHR